MGYKKRIMNFKKNINILLIAKKFYYNLAPRGLIRIITHYKFVYLVHVRLKRAHVTDLQFAGNNGVFAQYINGAIGKYAELGSGVSTIYVKKNSQLSVLSVDNSSKWHSLVKKAHRFSESDNLILVDLGEVIKGSYSVPQTYGKLFMFREYIDALFYDGTPDIVLLHGRFLLSAFLNLIIKIDKPVTILFAGYPSYPAARSIIEQFLLPDYIDNFWGVFLLNQREFDSEQYQIINNYINCGLFSLTNN